MAPKSTKIFQVLHLFAILAVPLIECRCMHSSSDGSHSSYEESHYGGESHTSFRNIFCGCFPIGSHTHQGSTIVYNPYQGHTVAIPGGGTYYHPAVQLYYPPPVHTVRTIPIYHPPPIIEAYVDRYEYNSEAHQPENHFLSGFLIGRASGNLDYDIYRHHKIVHHFDDSDYYYTIHNPYQNSEKVPTQFTIPGNLAVNCPENTSDSLCVPNSDALCLRNETIMCVTSINFTIPCVADNTSHCVFTRIQCKGELSCQEIQNQNYVEYYIPCLANVTVENNQGGVDNHELCVTAIADPKKVESPVGTVVLLLGKLGQFSLNEISEKYNRGVEMDVHKIFSNRGG